MSKFQKQIRQRQQAIKVREQEIINKADHNKPAKMINAGKLKNNRSFEIPTYDHRGKPVMPRRKARRKKLLAAVIAVTGTAAFIYVPQFCISDHNSQNTGEITVNTNMEAIRLSNAALRDGSSEDFDGDGVFNTDESAAGTNPWNIDTDSDGVTDYAELHITKTDPTTSTEILKDLQIKLDESEDKTIRDPYSISSVVMWPDNYDSKAYGSVVETVSGGYRFCGFSGSVLFPDSDNKYAYKVENNIHTLLPHDEKDNTWEVQDGDYVELYDSPLEECIRLSVFKKDFYLPSNWFSDFISRLLPKTGFLTASKMTVTDREQDKENDTINKIRRPSYSEEDPSRFTSNTTTIRDLGSVRTALEDGNCAAVSFFNTEAGEYLGIIYGMTESGDLLVADMDTKDEAGMIQITEKAGKMFNEEGEIVSVQYFDWCFDGFSSGNKDRISFFASTDIQHS